MPRRFTVRPHLIVLVPLLIAAGRTAHAADKFWDGGAPPSGLNGIFGDRLNWDSILSPGPNDVAHFGVTNSGTQLGYTVTFAEDEETEAFIVEDDRINLDLEGHIYTTTAGFQPIRIGTSPIHPGRVLMFDGTVIAPFDSIIGLGVGGTAFLTISTGGLLIGTANIIVGDSNDATLTISNNGDVIANDVNIGLGRVTGIATVLGPGSSLLAARLVVGFGGTGTLNVTGGADVDSASGVIGNESTSTGTALVDGAGSTWDISGPLTVGNVGDGTLNVTGGAGVDSTSGLIGNESTSTGTALVDGAGSTWDISGLLAVGSLGDGTLNITGGGRVISTVGTIDDLTFSAATTVMVSGANSRWEMSNFLGLDTGRLTIEAGGSVSNTDAFIGGGLGVLGSAVTVTGAGSTWTNSGTLNVNQLPTNVLTIADGGRVQSAACNLGAGVAFHGSATVTGVGSTWSNSGAFNVGLEGTGSLRIEAGGGVSTAQAFIGRKADSNGTVTVTGAGSAWSVSGNLFVGDLGNGVLHITGGGRVQSGQGVVGNFLGAEGTVNVDGDESLWDSSARLTVGGDGATGTLNVTDGGQVNSVGGILGFSGGDGTVAVNGPNSEWSNLGNLTVGSLGPGELRITGGGRVFSQTAIIAEAGTSMGTVTVDGDESLWSVLLPSPLSVGKGGAGRLNITGGGRVINSVGFIGEENGGQGVLSVFGANSAWIGSGTLFVGADGEAVVEIGAGGLVQAAGVFIGASAGGFGNILVDGANAKLTSTGALSIGRQGTGVLNLRSGGRVTNSSLARIAESAGSTGTVTVSGSGSQWTIDGRLEIGGFPGDNGGLGTLRVQPGGTVSVAEHTALFAGDQLILEGGTFGASEIRFNGGGTFSWTSGTLHVGLYPLNLVTPSGGILAPGNSVGQTHILGNYQQSPGGILEIEIGGPASADLVATDGVALLAGSLQLKLLDGFAPSQASTFTIFDSRGINGAFANIASGQRLATSDGNGSFLVHYGSGSPFDPDQIVLSSFLQAAGLLGDYNQNGVVDAADYVVWRNTLGQTGTGLAADGNTNGQIDDGDYNVWRSHFGRTSGSGSATGSATIPEPATLVLLCLTAIGIVTFRRRSSSTHPAACRHAMEGN